MPKNGSKEGIPSEIGTDYEKAQLMWGDFATRLGEQITAVLKERAEAQRQLYLRWMEFLKTQGVGNDIKIAETVHEYEKLYSHWTEFAEKTGEKVRDSMLNVWSEQKDSVTAWQDMFKERAKELGDPGNVDYRMLADKFWGDTKNFASSVTTMLPKDAGKNLEFPKESFENWLRFYTETIEVILKSPAFVAMLGTMLDNTLDMKKKNEDSTAEIIQSLGLPSRKDMDALYKKLHELSVQVREQNQTIKKLERGKGK